MELRFLILFTMFHIVANPYIRLPIPACVTVGSSCVRPYRNFAHTADTPPSNESTAQSHTVNCLESLLGTAVHRTRLVHISSICVYGRFTCRHLHGEAASCLVFRHDSCHFRLVSMLSGAMSCGTTVHVSSG